SSRRRHTRFSRDWSSDVCSSDLVEKHLLRTAREQDVGVVNIEGDVAAPLALLQQFLQQDLSIGEGLGEKQTPPAAIEDHVALGRRLLIAGDNFTSGQHGLVIFLSGHGSLTGCGFAARLPAGRSATASSRRGA